MHPRPEPLVLLSRAQLEAFANNSSCAIQGCAEPRVITGKVCRFHGILWQNLREEEHKKRYVRKRVPRPAQEKP